MVFLIDNTYLVNQSINHFFDVKMYSWPLVTSALLIGDTETKGMISQK